MSLMSLKDMFWPILALALLSPSPGPATSSIPKCPSPPCLFYSNIWSIKSTPLGGPVLTRKLASSQSHRIASLAVDVRRNILFWSEPDFIYSLDLTIGKVTTIRDKPYSKVRGLDVDWESSLLYYTDYFYQDVGVMTYDGQKKKTLVTSRVRNPHGIAVDPLKGYMFWADWGIQNAKIVRASLSGHGQTTLVNLQYTQYLPRGITLDFTATRVYWIDSRTNSIITVDYNGSNKRTVKRFPYNIKAFDLVMQGSMLYWSDLYYKEIWRTKKTTGATNNLLWEQYYNIKGLAVYDVARQPQGQTSCQTGRHNCSHLCLLTPSGGQCACPDDYTLASNGQTCYHQEFLIYAVTGHPIDRGIFTHKLHLDGSLGNQRQIPLTNLRKPFVLDFDRQTKLVYWTDVRLKQIVRAHLDGSAEMVIVNNLHTPEGVAVDEVGRNLYWTDAGLDTLEVAKLDGSSRRTLFTNLHEPMSLALDTTRGYLYFCSWGGNHYAVLPKIERVDMDGTNLQLVRQFSSSDKRPNALAMDHPTNRIYWIDEWMDSLMYCNVTDVTLRQCNPQTVISSGHSLSLFGLAIHDNYVYFTDHRKIYRASKTSGTGKVLVTTIPGGKLRDVHVFYNDSVIPAPHPCSINNGGCTHLCLLKPGSNYQCACPTYHVSGCSTTPLPPVTTHAPTTSQLTTTVAATTAQTTTGRPTTQSTTTQVVTTTEAPTTKLTTPKATTQQTTTQIVTTTEAPTTQPTTPKATTKQTTTQVVTTTEAPTTQPTTPKATTQQTTTQVVTTTEASTTQPTTPKATTQQTTTQVVTTTQAPTTQPTTPKTTTQQTTTQVVTTTEAPTTQPTTPKATTQQTTTQVVTTTEASTTQPTTPKATTQQTTTTSQPPVVTTKETTTGTTVTTQAPTTTKVPTTTASTLPPTTQQTTVQSTSTTSTTEQTTTTTLETTTATETPTTTAAPTESTQHPTTTKQPATATPTSKPPRDPCVPSPCVNGQCIRKRRIEKGYVCLCPDEFTGALCDLFYGDNSVTMTIEITLREWKLLIFQDSIAKAFDGYCSKKTCDFEEGFSEPARRRRRAINDVTFKVSDVIIIKDPIAVQNDHVKVETVVLQPSEVTMKDNARKPIARNTLCLLVRETRLTIASYLGGHRVLTINGEEKPRCGEGTGGSGGKNKGGDPQSASSTDSSGSIAGGVVGVILVILALVLVGFFFYRRRKPRTRLRNESERIDVSFNNPGYAAEASANNPALAEPIYDEIASVHYDSIGGATPAPVQGQQLRVNLDNHHGKMVDQGKRPIRLGQKFERENTAVGLCDIDLGNELGKSVDLGSADYKCKLQVNLDSKADEEERYVSLETISRRSCRGKHELPGCDSAGYSKLQPRPARERDLGTTRGDGYDHLHKQHAGRPRRPRMDLPSPIYDNPDEGKSVAIHKPRKHPGTKPKQRRHYVNAANGKPRDKTGPSGYENATNGKPKSHPGIQSSHPGYYENAGAVSRDKGYENVRTPPKLPPRSTRVNGIVPNRGISSLSDNVLYADIEQKDRPACQSARQETGNVLKITEKTAKEETII